MLAMVIPGLLVVVVGVFAATNLSSLWVKTYIGVLVIFMIILCLSPLQYKFAWWKHYAVGILAAFNKALSVGGFGPVTSTGGIIGGLESKYPLLLPLWLRSVFVLRYLLYTYFLLVI